MATKKKGFISRMIEGPERSEGYARSTLPGNRWELGWDVFRNNMGKMFGINLLMLLFALPVIALILLRYFQVQYYALLMPFSQNIGLGYPAYPIYSGITEEIYLMANRSSILFLPIASIIASVGLAGGMYVMRNMVWSEGVIVGSDFWTGVKKNFGIVLLSTLFYTILLTACLFSLSYIDWIVAVKGTNFWLTISKVFSYIMLGFLSITYLYMLSMGVTYELKFTQLIRNAMIMTIALIPTNIFFAAFALVTFVIMALGQLGISLGLVILVMFGVSGAALIWTNYSQWAFDKFINDKVAGAVKNRGIYSKEAEENVDFSFECSSLGKRPIKPITDYDVEIVEIPENFSRADLIKLEESKAEMRRISDEYIEDVLSGKIKEDEQVDPSIEDENPIDDDSIDGGTDE